MSGNRFDRLKVLVVDNNPHMRKIVVTILQAFGITQVFEASDGEKSWRIVKDNNPDIVILDCVLDGMSGIELTRTIRRSPDSPNPFMPVIMLTGHTKLDHVREARDAGISEFLAKPVSVKAILTRLTAVVEHPRPFVRTKAYFGPCRRRRNTAEYQGPERRNGDGEFDSAEPAQAAG